MKKLLLLLTFLCSTQSFAYNGKPIRSQVEADWRSGDKVRMANRADVALNSLVRTTIWKMKKEGHKAQALKAEDEWEGKFKGSLSKYMEAVVAGRMNDIGDYKPLSQWLADWYDVLELVLGKTVCEKMHFDDIKTFNFTIPVVFHMEKVLGPVWIVFPEYEKHFDPFAGVVTYWSIWAGCEAATYGTGYVLICTPAGEIGEKIMVRYIAPRLAPKVYPIFWKQQ